LPHTADAQVAAWAPTREECLRQAALGSVDLFVDTAGARAASTHTFRVEGEDEQLLVAVLEEIVFLLDTTGAVPVDVAVTSYDGGCDVRFDTVQARTLPQIGAVPKAVSLHQLRFASTEDGWSGLVTWDV
jgi:SHS2 domain-containing protein